MNKAKFIGKHFGSGYERNMVFLEYEYKGMRYTVYENMSKGNEPLSWQHRTEQAKIDSIIEMKKREVADSKGFDMDEIWKMLGFDEEE